MHVFRLCKKQYSATVLSGAGGLEADGRWHTQGHRIVYCATSEALAVLEMRVHVGRFIPRKPFVMHEIFISDDAIHALPKKDLPRHWNGVPHSHLTQAIGDAWLTQTRYSALKVPSIHSHTDWNILVNPEHDAARDIKVVSHRPYLFDPRLF